MSYTPTNWKAGDTVTSAKLNKMEQGIANSDNGILVINESLEPNSDTLYLNKTYAEIISAAQEGKFIIFIEMSGSNNDIFVEYYYFLLCKKQSDQYVVSFKQLSNDRFRSFYTDSYNDYPSRTMEVL